MLERQRELNPDVAVHRQQCQASTFDQAAMTHCGEVGGGRLVEQ